MWFSRDQLLRFAGSLLCLSWICVATDSAAQRASRPIQALGEPKVDDGGMRHLNLPKDGVPSWDARQMLGEPDTTGSGDIATAWASSNQDETKVWIELGYSKPIDAAGLHIYETYNPGAVYQVSGFVGNKEVRLWHGVDPTPTSEARGISKIKIRPDGPISKIRIYLDSPRVPGWNEIDAVGLVDTKGKTHWAIDAKASSNYADSNLDVPFFDPFVSPEQQLTEDILKLRREIESQKAGVRALRAQIDARNARIRLLYDELDALADKKSGR